jgi:aspartyl-tRNA synthetase
MRVKENDEVETQVGKFFTVDQLNALRDAVGASASDMMFFIAGSEKVAATAMGQLRLEIARIKGLMNPSVREFVWITDSLCLNIANRRALHEYASSIHKPNARTFRNDAFWELKRLQCSSL